ncbi:MAG: hypothetical protein IKE21_01300 [Erysipelotrichaceae bacterium]|nr:hypothetical protein [Erysipelotrichaceae bacterium]
MKKMKKKILTALVSMTLLVSGISAVYAEGPGGTPPDGAPGGAPPDGAGGGMPGGGSSAVSEWDAVYEVTEDTTEENGVYDSTGTDENVIHVSEGTLTLIDPTITRSSDSQGGDDASFYGVGAAVLTTGGTTVISGGSITTEGNGAAGAFSYSDGVTYIADTVIRTSGNTAGGIHAAGGGALYAYDLNVETQGGSSAAIRSDRGGGTMVVDGGTYTANGSGSPAVYVTADITIHDAELTANGSEGICIEGLNTLRLFDCDLTSAMPDDSQNDSSWSVILYQSMSGDSEVGNSSFYMIGGSLTSTNGGLFYSTNTESTFYLEDVEITAAEDSEYFLRVSGNANQRGWGSTGSNGAQTVFTAVNQEMNGDVIYDSISTLDLYILEGSVLKGAILDDESYAGDGGNGYANVTIDAGSSWIVTADSVVTALNNAGRIVDEEGKTVSIVSTDGTVYVEGESAYTVTVASYSEEADVSGAVAAVNWEDYQTDFPLERETEETEAAESEAPAETEIPEASEAAAEEAAEKSSSALPAVLGGAAVAAIAAVLWLRKKK